MLYGLCRLYYGGQVDRLGSNILPTQEREFPILIYYSSARGNQECGRHVQ